MAKNTNNKELLKRYSNALRERLDKDIYITRKDIEALINKYHISKEDITRIETLSKKQLTTSKEKLEFGSWREAEDLIIESLYLTPFDRDSLVHYLNLIIEKEKDLGMPKPNEYRIYLERLKKIDKKLYKKYLSNKKSKINQKIFLLLVLPLLIPLFFIIKDKPKEKSVKKNNNKPIVLSSIGNRQIIATYIKNPQYKLDFYIVESELTGYKSDYSYNLKAMIISENLNISYIKGVVIWYNQFDEKIFTDTISTAKGPTYYKNEEIPIIYSKSSKRISPDLYRVEVFINEVISSNGLERTSKTPVETTFNNKKSYNIEVAELYREITYGVTSNYLSLTLEVTNIGLNNINYLEVDLIWYDFYNVEKFKKRITLVDSKDIAILKNSSRVIPLIFETEELENSYKIEVLKINE